MNEYDEPSLLERIRVEREQLERDMARRREQLERDETLAEAEARNAARTVTKSQAPRDYGRHHRAAPAPASLTRDWQDYIKGQLDRRDRAILRAVAVAGVEEEKARQVEIAELRQRVTTLENELRAIGQDRGRLRSLPLSSPEALIA